MWYSNFSYLWWIIPIKLLFLKKFIFPVDPTLNLINKSIVNARGVIQYHAICTPTLQKYHIILRPNPQYTIYLVLAYNFCSHIYFLIKYLKWSYMSMCYNLIISWQTHKHVMKNEERFELNECRFELS